MVAVAALSGSVPNCEELLSNYPHLRRWKQLRPRHPTGPSKNSVPCAFKPVLKVMFFSSFVQIQYNIGPWKFTFGMCWHDLRSCSNIMGVPCSSDSRNLQVCQATWWLVSKYSILISHIGACNLSLMPKMINRSLTNLTSPHKSPWPLT